MHSAPKTALLTPLASLSLGPYFNQQYNGEFGFYSRFLLPPLPPAVTASEGDLIDRIQVEWIVDPLSPSPELGFNIYRDGAFIGHVEKEIRIFVDFNVQAGKFYQYEVSGISSFGEGRKGSGLGFLNPNGTVTGQVKTFNGNPVVDAEITLTPTLGAALAFTGDDVAFAEYKAAFISPKWSVSGWVKIGAGNNNASIIDFGSPTAKNWWLTTNGTSKGVKFNVGAQSLAKNFSTDPDGWHHVAATYSGSSLLLYVDGELIGTASAPISGGPNLPLFSDANPTAPPIFSPGVRQHAPVQPPAVTNGNQPVQKPHGQFRRRRPRRVLEIRRRRRRQSLDLSPNASTIYLCGPAWSASRPNVVNGAVTSETGFYKIEGINYGGGTTFTAVAAKKVYDNYALEFNAANQNYTVLTDSILPGAQNASVELWVQNFENSATPRTVLANQAASGATNFFH